MKKLLIPLLFLAGLACQAQFVSSVFTHVGASGFTIVNHTSASGTTGATVSTSATPINTTGANACFVAVGGYALTIPGGTTVTDNKSNTYVAVPTTTTGAVTNVVLFYSKGLTVGTGHYWSASTSSGGYMAIGVLCVNGSILTGGADQENDARPTASTSVQAGSVTPTNTNQLVLNVTGVDNSGARVSSINSGFTLIENVAPSANNYGLGFSYLIETAAVAQNPSVALSATPSNPAMAINATFKNH